MTNVALLADSLLDREALEGFRQRYGDISLGPICVVIPAYEEERSIGSVLEQVPADVHGMSTTTVVVVDGGADATAQVVLEHGAYACVCTANRGQGAALRLGYRLARSRGARFIVIVDADGQWDPKEMNLVVAPLVADEADFVQGSRRLGAALNDDRLRAAGVRFFAATVSALTGTKVTDTSSGFRAFRAEVVDNLILEQDQYQSSELLIGVLLGGWRVVERPITMRARTAGATKKGSNLVYGARYSRVVARTWWREWRRHR